MARNPRGASVFAPAAAILVLGGLSLLASFQFMAAKQPTPKAERAMPEMPVRVLAASVFPGAHHADPVPMPQDLDAGVCVQNRKFGFHCMPSFICIGAQKSSTRELHEWLSSHPQLQSPTEELHFFDNVPEEKRLGLWYQYLRRPEFRLSTAEVRKRILTFEKTPNYLPEGSRAAIPMAAMMPSVQLLVVLREPAARAFSAYHHHCRKGRLVATNPTDMVFAQPNRQSTLAHEIAEPMSINASVNGGGNAGLVCGNEGFLRYVSSTNATPSDFRELDSILGYGCYASQLREWLAVFPRKQFLILFAENFVADPHRTVTRVTDWLGIPEHKYDATRNRNGYWVIRDRSSKGNAAPYEPLWEETRRLLDGYYAESNRELRRMFPELSFPW